VRISRRPISALALASSLLLTASCGDPQLTLSMFITDAYRSMLTSVGLQIIEPPASQPFTCDDLAFGRVDPNVVQLRKVGEVSTDRLRTPINDVNRTTSKLFVADGFDQNKRRLITGCAAVGAINQNVDAIINAEPVVIVTPPMNVSLSGPEGQSLQNPIELQVADVLGTALSNIQAAWSIEGAAGAGSTGMATSDNNGRVMIQPNLPSRPGPFVLDIRVRWAQDQAPLIINGAVRPVAKPLTLDAHALDYASGAIGPNGEKGVAALVIDGVGAKVALSYKSAQGFTTKLSGHIDGAVFQLGVIDYSGNGARDHVIVVTDTGAWVEIDGNGATQFGTYPQPNPPLGPFPPSRILSTGGCADGTEPLVLLMFTEGSVPAETVSFAVYSASTHQVVSGPYALTRPGEQSPFELIGSGCVSDQNNQLTRVWALGGAGFGVTVIVPRMTLNPLIEGLWLALSQATAFSPAIGDRRMIFGTQLRMNDIVVSRATINLVMNDLKIDVIGSDAIPNVPISTAAGDVDGDGAVDLVSLFVRPAPMMTTDVQHAIWTSLGREHGGQRITGDVDLAVKNLRSPKLLLADLNGDGVDDIFIGEVVPVGGGSPSTAMVFYMGSAQ
jgi:hypothetical protein